MERLELPIPVMPVAKHETPFGPPATPEPEPEPTPAPAPKKAPAKPKA
jgi:hypothetical protein